MCVFVPIYVTFIPYTLCPIPHILGTSRGDGKCYMVDNSGNLTIIYMFSVIIFGLLIPIVVISTLNTMIFLGIRSRVKYKFNPNASSTAEISVSEPDEVKPPKDDVVTDGRSLSPIDTPTVTVATPTRNPKRKPLTKQDRNLVTILLLVTVSFVLLNSPQIIRASMNYILKFHGPKSPELKARDHFAWAFTNTLNTINYAINFFLYCLSSRKFRQDFITRVGCSSRSP